MNEQLDDRALREAAQRLGAQADRLDPERTAQAVLARLREPVAARRSVFAEPVVWLRIAATLVVIVGSGLLVRLVHTRPDRSVSSIPALQEPSLNDLSASELREMLQSADDSSLGTVTTPTPGLEDLTAPELQRLLQSLES